MAFYGTDFLTAFNLKTNASYSQALSTAKLSALLNEALVKVVEEIYRNGSSEYLSDTVRAMIVSNSVVTVTNNVINTAAISLYNHYLIVKCIIQDATFRAVLVNILLVDGIFTRIVFNKASALRSTEQVILTGTPCDGQYYVKQLTDKVYELYTDETLLIPFYNGLPYANAGTAKRVLETYAMPYESQDKIGELSNPTIYFPKAEKANNTLKLYAGGSNIISAQLDYITTPPVAIDVTNSSTDLSVYYPLELTYQVVDRAAQLFAELTRDPVLTQSTLFEQQQDNKVTPQ